MGSDSHGFDRATIAESTRQVTGAGAWKEINSNIILLRLEGEAITAKGKTMNTEQLWQEQFHERKAKGQNSERLFMMHIACMGGAAQSLAAVP